MVRVGPGRGVLVGAVGVGLVEGVVVAVVPALGVVDAGSGGGTNGASVVSLQLSASPALSAPFINAGCGNRLLVGSVETFDP